MDALLSVRGSELVRPDGTPVVLRGVGLGGWMNMENFITGYPATESQMRRALRRVLGDEGYDRFFERFYSAFFGPADAELLASIGLNCVRIPFNYRHFENDERPFEFKEEGFARLDRAVRACADHGLYAILDLHAVPGAQNQHWHSDNPTHWASLWTYKDIGLQGLVYAAPDSPYRTRIGPFLEKKARLGADSWGAVDTGIRHVMEPIERLFAEEFPDFEPYPWGKQRWIQLLVRHIMLAEPLVDQYAAAFAGVTPAMAADLADSFALDRCVRREELIEVLATA